MILEDGFPGKQGAGRTRLQPYRKIKTYEPPEPAMVQFSFVFGPIGQMNTDPQVDFSRLAYFCATTPNTPDSLMALMLLYKKQKKEKKSRPRP